MGCHALLQGIFPTQGSNPGLLPQLEETPETPPSSRAEGGMQDTQVRSLGQEVPQEEGMATHSTILAWRTPWTVAHEAPLSTGFSQQEYWSGLPCPPPGNLPNPGIKPTSPVSPAFQADSLPLSHHFYIMYLLQVAVSGFSVQTTDICT